MGHSSSGLDLPWCGEAIVSQQCPCHGVKWPWALRCTIGPPVWTGSSQECISSHVPFHMPFSVLFKFSLLCQLPLAATACSQTCGSCLRAPWVSKLSEAAQGLLSQRVPCSRLLPKLCGLHLTQLCILLLCNIKKCKLNYKV